MRKGKENKRKNHLLQHLCIVRDYRCSGAWCCMDLLGKDLILVRRLEYFRSSLSSYPFPCDCHDFIEGRSTTTSPRFPHRGPPLPPPPPSPLPNWPTFHFAQGITNSPQYPVPNRRLNAYISPSRSLDQSLSSSQTCTCLLSTLSCSYPGNGVIELSSILARCNTTCTVSVFMAISPK